MFKGLLVSVAVAMVVVYAANNVAAVKSIIGPK
jgi:hypothetical protein